MLQAALSDFLFSREWLADDHWSVIEEHCRRGWATATPCTTQSQASVLSIAYKEPHQSRTSELPVGARSLLLDQSDGSRSIVLRGLNKFQDFDKVAHTPLLLSLAQTAGVRLSLQKKLAGFVIHLFSLDGVHVEVMSKHSLDGRHVAEAMRVFDEAHAPADAARLAQALWRDKLVVSGECVSPAWDATHPIIEDGAARIEYFAVGPRCDRMEVSWPTSVAAEWCAHHSLSFVPHKALQVEAVLSEVDDVLRQTSKWLLASEGFVLVVEVPATYLLPSAAPTLVAPIRFKLKSIRYRLLRCLRSHLTGEHTLSPQHPLYLHPYMTMFLRWVVDLQDAPLSTVAEIGAYVKLHGIWKWSNDFEADLSRMGRKRARDADSEQLSPLHELLNIVDRAAAGPCAAHQAVMMCGIPGAGKSTVALDVAARQRNFRAVVYISRDAIAAQLTRALYSDATAPPSNHQLRRLKKATHEGYCQRIADTARWLTFETEPVLILLDACHASRAARRAFREQLEGVQVFTCVDMSMGNDPLCAVRRATARTGHEVLEACDAERAVVDVHRVFEAPSIAENFDEVVTVDAARLTPTEAADQILRSLISNSVHNEGPAPLIASAIAPNYPALLPMCTSLIGATSWKEGLAYINTMSVSMPASLCLIPTSTDAGALKTALWDYVVSALVDASATPEQHTSLAPPKPSVAARLVAWWRGEGGTSRADSTSSSSCAVLDGHVKWIPGTFLVRDRTIAVTRCEHEALTAALRLRYEGDLPPDDRCTVHVTLQYEKGRNASSRVEAQCNIMREQLGELFDVTVTGVLLDPRGACLSVDVSPCVTSGGGVSAKQLHITLGHTHHVKAAYSLDMLQRCVDPCPLSKGQLHNFCRLKPSVPMQLKMRLAVVHHGK